MNTQKHKSMRPNPGVKRIQNYLFKFCDFLGKGNFSSVYKGINELTNETVAIKYIALSSLTCERLKQLLDQQIEILTSLNHPHIIKCFEVLKSSHNCYIITELCDGGDLQGLFKKKRQLTEEEIIPYVRDIFEGLYYLSKKNIIHRDIKLANIFLSKGKAKIADFGFAHRAKKQFNDGKIGTPLCMSPEGFLQNLYGSKTDVWAFGVILYQLTHGKLPLEYCTTEQMLRQNIQVQLKVQQLNKSLSPELKQLIIKCLDINPCTRPTFQEIKNSQFIRKITGDRLQSFSLQDLRLIPSLHPKKSDQSQHQSFIVSLKTLDNTQFCHLNQTQKIKISQQTQKKNFRFGTNKICEDLKPQNTVLKIQKQQRCSCRPANIQIPTITFIPVRVRNKQKYGDQSPVIVQSPFEQNEGYEIKVSHKSHSTLPVESTQLSLNPTLNKDESMISTADKLQVPSVPFRRHKGSFEMSATQQQQLVLICKQVNKTGALTSRNEIEPMESQKKQKNTGIDICPVTNTKRLLNGFMKFNEAIGIIHYCRLIYKYIMQLRSTGIYHDGDLNLRYYSNYLLNLLNQLNVKLSCDHIILAKATTEQENKDGKINKMKKVIEEYIERYKPNLEKERGDYLNRNTGQIKHIAQLDQRFIETFFIPEKSKLQNYNCKVVKFSEILQKCSRYQRYAQFDSNKQLEESTKQQKKQKKQKKQKSQKPQKPQKLYRPPFTEKSQNIQPRQILSRTQTLSNKIEPISKMTSIQLQENVPMSIQERRISFH